MHTHPDQFQFQRQVGFLGLAADHRLLIEQVFASNSVNREVQRRAHALLLLDQAAPISDIAQIVPMDPRTIRALIRRHKLSGVRAALLRQRAARRSHA